MNTKKLIFIIGGLILIGFVAIFVYWLKFVEPEIKVFPIERTEKMIMVEDLCAEFPRIEGELDCREVMSRVLVEYPGKFYFIEKIPVLTLIGGKEIKRERWKVTISFLEEPIRRSPDNEFSHQVTVVANRYKLNDNEEDISLDVYGIW